MRKYTALFALATLGVLGSCSSHSDKASVPMQEMMPREVVKHPVSSYNTENTKTDSSVDSRGKNVICGFVSGGIMELKDNPDPNDPNGYDQFIKKYEMKRLPNFKNTVPAKYYELTEKFFNDDTYYKSHPKELAEFHSWCGKDWTVNIYDQPGH